MPASQSVYDKSLNLATRRLWRPCIPSVTALSHSRKQERYAALRVDQHTAVGRSGIVSKIFSADWQAGFPGIAGNAEIDSIGGSDQRAKDHLS